MTCASRLDIERSVNSILDVTCGKRYQKNKMYHLFLVCIIRPMCVFELNFGRKQYPSVPVFIEHTVFMKLRYESV
jgi:hypothetical protein